jgi:hypothetical protein
MHLVHRFLLLHMLYPALDKIYLCNREILLYVSHYDEGDHQKIKLFLDRKR